MQIRFPRRQVLPRHRLWRMQAGGPGSTPSARTTAARPCSMPSSPGELGLIDGVVNGLTRNRLSAPASRLSARPSTAASRQASIDTSCRRTAMSGIRGTVAGELRYTHPPPARASSASPMRSTANTPGTSSPRPEPTAFPSRRSRSSSARSTRSPATYSEEVRRDAGGATFLAARRLWRLGIDRFGRPGPLYARR